MAARRSAVSVLALAAPLALGACRAKVEPARAEPRQPPRASGSAHASATPSASVSAATISAPSEQAPLGELRAFALGAPTHPDAARVRRAHDQRLLPCPGSPPSAWCTPHTELVAWGVLRRGQAYLRDCLLCREKKGVEAWSHA